MNKKNFDKMSNMLLDKLTEEYDLLAEEVDGFSGETQPDPQKQLQNTLRNKAKKETEEAHDSFVAQQNSTTDENKNLNKLVHKKKVIKREDAIQNKRKYDYAIMSEDMNLTDDDYYYLAEEFENDLNKSPQEVLLDKNIEKAKNDIAKEKEDLKDKQKEQKEKVAEQAQQDKEEKAEELSNLNKNQTEDKEKLADENEKVNNAAEQKIEQTEKKLEKMQSVKKFVGGKDMNEDLKQEIQQVQEIEESIKTAIQDNKTKKATIKRDKAQKKIESIDLKLSKLGQDLEKADWKHKTAKCEKLKRQIEVLKLKKEHITRDFQDYDEKVAQGEFQKSLRETLEFEMDYERMYKQLEELEESVDKLVGEAEENINSDEEYINKDTEGCDEILYGNTSYDDPMLDEIANKIKEELNKETPDKTKIKQLKLKWRKIKNLKDKK